MRLFAALPLSDSLRRSLETVRPALEERLPGARWVPGGNLHLTLKFLGEVAETRLEPVRAALGEAAAAPGFEFSVAGLGVFPDVRRPAVLWAGVSEGAAAVARLANDLEARLAERGFPPEPRGFHAHVTLARFKPGARVPAPIWPAEWDSHPFGACAAGELRLMRSELRPGGAEYQVLSHVALAPRA